MELMAIGKEDLPGFVERLMLDYEVVAPVPKGSRYAYGKVEKFSDMALGYDTTLLPPKKYLLPRREELFRYSLDGGITITPKVDKTRRVIFGMHSCDINAVWLLDDVLAEGIPDGPYIARRANTFIVGLDCEEPCWERSFCGSMKSNRPGGGYDLYLVDLGSLYVVLTGARKASELVALGKFFPANYSISDAFYEKWRAKESVFPDRVGYDTGRLPAFLADAYESVVWDALEERCFDCGACTVVCPSCYCFDVVDEPDLDMKGGVRYRKWDGCQMKAFASVAGGGNFRGKRSDRLRHRMMRKGRYFKEKFGRFACVGCGRCGKACLAEIDILDVFRQLR